MIGALILMVVTSAAGTANTAEKTRKSAAHRFLAAYPEAQFIEDGAADRFYIVHGFATPIIGDMVNETRAFALEHGGLLGLTDSGVDLELDRAVNSRGHTFVRFDQLVDGAPVFGAKVNVHVDQQGQIIKLNSTAVARVQPLDGRLIGVDAAVAAVREMVPNGVEQAEVVLGYLPIHEIAVAVYQVVLLEPGPHLWFAYVDADSGAVLMRYDAVRRHDAEIFLEDPLSNFDTTLVTLENLVPDGEHAYHTYGDYVRVAKCTSFNYECDNWTFEAEATDEDGFTNYEPSYTPNDLNDGFAEVQTYYGVDTFYTHMRDDLGFDGYFVDAESGLPGNSIWIFVNMNFSNGFFMGANDYYGTPDLIALGQGEKDYAYDNDVSQHEFTHAVSSKMFDVWMVTLDSMGPDFSGQAIEEGNADYFPCSWHNSAQLGEFLGIGRDLENDYTCPERLWGEGHHDGQILSGALWEMREELGATKVDHIQYQALLANSMSNFGQWSDAIKLQAYMMTSEEDPELLLTTAEFELVEDIIAARNTEFCVRAVPIEHEGWAFQYMPYTIGTGGTPSAVQYVISSLADTETLELVIEPYVDRYDILVRADEPVEFSWSQSGYNWSWEAQYDMRFLNGGDYITSAKISNLTELKLEQNTDYFFSIICFVNNGCQNELSALLSDQPDIPEEDAGNGDGGDQDAGPDAGGKSGDSSGCDCRVGPGAEHRGLIDTVIGIL
jgi:Zn-dependent metalloprotease